jgi:hypothetical protein
MEEDLSFNPWYFDEENNPICSSLWEDYECEDLVCPFSHKYPKYQSEVPIKTDVLENPLELYEYLKVYITNYPNPEEIQQVKLPITKEEDKDFERINQLMTEMLNFEKGPEIFDSHVICPFITETGNCIIKDLCEFAHSSDDQKIKDIEKEQEWYPSSMSCTCCKGYVYGCITENCKKEGKCLVCVN